MACTACLVCLVSSVSGCCNNVLGRGSACSGHITNLEQSAFLRYLWSRLISDQVAWIKVHLRQTWNFRSHAVSAYIGLRHHRLMHAPHRLMHACAACIAPWHHGLMHAVTAWALLFWFCLRYTLTSSYFVRGTLCQWRRKKFHDNDYSRKKLVTAQAS